MNPNENLFIKDTGFLTWGLRLLDSVVLTGSGLVVYAYYVPNTEPSRFYWLAFILAFLLSLAFFPLFGIYTSWRGKSVFRQFHKIFLACSTVFISLILISALLKTTQYFSRAWFLAWVVVGLFSLILCRKLMTSFSRYLRKKGWNLKNVVIIGNPHFNTRIEERIQQSEWAGFRIRESIDRVLPAEAEVFLKRLGEQNIHEIWLTYSLKDSELVNELLHITRHSPHVRIRYIPDISDFQLLLNNSVSEVAGIVTLDLNHPSLEGFNVILKEVEDRVLAFCFLVVGLPFFVLIAIAIKLDSRGPILFKQKRHGWGALPINVYKFRTMSVESCQQNGFVQAKKADSRVTRVGAFLRRTSLDELPQFFNVLQGRMSIVGPRPHAVEHNLQFMDLVDHYFARNKVKPGITGWAQVNGWRGETDTLDKMEKRVEHDLYYIRNWSLWLDLKIIFLTAFRLVGKNVY